MQFSFTALLSVLKTDIKLFKWRWKAREWIYVILDQWPFEKSLDVKRGSCFTPIHARRVVLLSLRELGTISRNNLRGITLTLRTVWGVNSLNLILSCYMKLPFVLLLSPRCLTPACRLERPSAKLELKHTTLNAQDLAAFFSRQC